MVRSVIGAGRRLCRAGLLVAIVSVGTGGCGGQHGAQRTLAAVGSVLVVGGSTSWAFGERRDSAPLVNAGFGLVAAGVAAVITSGAWMAASISCETDADCNESEACREIPAPPGGVPYRQCVPR